MTDMGLTVKQKFMKLQSKILLVDNTQIHAYVPTIDPSEVLLNWPIIQCQFEERNLCDARALMNARSKTTEVGM